MADVDTELTSPSQCPMNSSAEYPSASSSALLAHNTCPVGDNQCSAMGALRKKSINSSLTDAELSLLRSKDGMESPVSSSLGQWGVGRPGTCGA